MLAQTLSFCLRLLRLWGLLSLVKFGTAVDIPANVRDFYDAVRARGHCTNELANGFYSSDGGPNSISPPQPHSHSRASLLTTPAFAYCGNYLGSGMIYIQGRNGALANMDVDCDGVQGGPADDGRCRQALSPDYQNTTAFQSILASYNRNITDLNPYVHSYVVFGNTRSTHPSGWSTFDPTSQGMRPLSLMAVVCPDYRLVYGVWGDTNGDDGSKPMVGEASLSLATVCGGSSVNGNSGIDEDAVLYIGFTGEEAVPGPDGADWAATSPGAFQDSLRSLGDRLVQRVHYVRTGRDGPSSMGRQLETVDAVRMMMAVIIVAGILLWIRMIAMVAQSM